MFPAFSILGFFYGITCIGESEFDVAMLPEIVPTWNNEILALVINPEALLFANPVANLACAADSAGALAGRPVNSLFWCMG
ncbi:TraU family protein, partial [Micrococcus sp. SIMBA_131]